jgi:hypothetical protein
MADCTVTMTQTEIEHALHHFSRRQHRLAEMIAAASSPLHATLRRDLEEDVRILRGLQDKFLAAAAKPRYTWPSGLTPPASWRGCPSSWTDPYPKPPEAPAARAQRPPRGLLFARQGGRLALRRVRWL